MVAGLPIGRCQGPTPLLQAGLPIGYEPSEWGIPMANAEAPPTSSKPVLLLAASYGSGASHWLTLRPHPPPGGDARPLQDAGGSAEGAGGATPTSGVSPAPLPIIDLSLYMFMFLITSTGVINCRTRRLMDASNKRWLRAAQVWQRRPVTSLPVPV